MTKSRAKSTRLIRRGYAVRGRFWIDGSDGTFLGHGRVVLLERIRDLGSISKAAASMEMSYRHAWELVESMNRNGEKPLVISTAGGQGGGGAKLTEEGESAIELFWGLCERFNDLLSEMQERLDDKELL